MDNSGKVEEANTDEDEDETPWPEAGHHLERKCVVQAKWCERQRAAQRGGVGLWG